MNLRNLLASLAVAASTILPAVAGPHATDPLAAVDLHRTAIINDIVGTYDAGFARLSPAQRLLMSPPLARRLAALRADQLLAASLTSSRESLELILAEAEKTASAAATHTSTKSLGSAATDLVYTPIAPCRLIDTRGNGAPIQGGAFTPNQRRSYVPNGLCGLPTSNVASLLVSFTTENHTPNSGGYLAILAPAAAVTTSVDIFNLGSEWSASNTAVATGSAAQFDVFVSTANAEVVIDVLGYFAPPQGGAVTSITAGPNLTGGTITSTGTIDLADSPSLVGNLNLAASTASAGNILKAGAPFIHNFGSINTFVGISSGNLTMTGQANTAIGVNSLKSNTSGSSNAALGLNALTSNTTGQLNTATGQGALAFTTTGVQNVASGQAALFQNVGGSNNIGIGWHAGFNLTSGDLNVYVGNQGVATESSTIRIGDANHTRAFIAGIRGVTTGGAALAVLVDANGQLGTVSSSRRFKDDIADMDAASSALLKLRPVTFHYKSDQQPSGRTLQYGLIAEEVAEVYPGLVARSADGQIESVMYQYLPSMLLNEYQKQQRTIAAQSSRIAALDTHIVQLEASHRIEIAGLRQAVAEMNQLTRRLAEQLEGRQVSAAAAQLR